MVRDVRRVASSVSTEQARRRRGALADRVVRAASAADVDGCLSGPAERAIDLLALGSALTRLVPLPEAGAHAAGPPGPVAAALDLTRDGATEPAECALESEHAAETFDRASSAIETYTEAAAAAESLRDAARITRREESAFVARGKQHWPG